MGHGPAETIEHAEHAAHAAHDSFDRVVTISIAMLAAGLACVTILSHKTHNMMLSRQIEAGIDSNKGANRWAQFQAYNIRGHMYKTFVDLAETDSGTVVEGKRKDVIAGWRKQAEKYEKPETGKLAEAERFAKQHDADSERKMAESEQIHHKAERLDLGDLGLQLGVVLASMAILTKRRVFWYAGVTCGIVGFLWAMTGYFEIMMPHERHAAHATPGEGHAPKSGEHGGHGTEKK